MDDIAYIISEKIELFERQVSKLREKFGLTMSAAFISFHSRLFQFKITIIDLPTSGITKVTKPSFISYNSS